jgi:hypothetical protein
MSAVQAMIKAHVTTTARVTMTTILLAATLLTAGCGGGSANPPGGSVTPTSPTGSTSGSIPGSFPATTSGGPSGATSAGVADLTIVVDSGSGSTTTWHLTCDPQGGNHPTPERACAVLAQHGTTALPAVPTDRMCTQIYGGPQTAHITGTWRGERVDARLSRNNGCEIARWNALVGLLPSAQA